MEKTRAQQTGQSLTKENCHNSRTSDDIDMKLGPVTYIDKKNKSTAKNIWQDVMSANCDVIAIFLIYGLFGAIQKQDTRRIRIVFKFKLLLTVTFYLTKTGNRTKKSLTQLSHSTALCKGTIFAKKC